MNFKTKIERLDTEQILNSKYINWDYFKNSTVLVTGATGLIGSQIVRTLLFAYEVKGLNVRVLALVRNKNKAEKMFFNQEMGTDIVTYNAPKQNKIKPNLRFIVQDIMTPLNIKETVDFIIHTANTTSSKDFAQKPVETIESVINGTRNVLNFAKNKNVKGCVYLSSVEVYGKQDFNKEEPLKENEYGYVDILKERNSYPLAKQLAESLCYSYAKEYNLPVKIARLTQTIGAGVDINDNRVFAQFARNIVLREDIVLKTQGETTRSYCYITDAVSALFVLLEKGECGGVYNVSNPEATCSIKEMAVFLTKKYIGSKYKFDISDNSYYLEKVKYVPDVTKLKELGWAPEISLEEMFNRLIQDFYLRPRPVKALKKKKSLISRIGRFLFEVANIQEYKRIRVLGFEFKRVKKKKFAGISNQYDIDSNKVVFIDNHGQGYCGNLKYIAEELINRKTNCELVWIDYSGKNIKTEFPSCINLVNPRSKEAVIECSKAKVWVASQRNIEMVREGRVKKEGQYYIQTWHGSLGIKKVGFDINSQYEQPQIVFSKMDSQMIDYTISNSDFETAVYRSIFWNQGEPLLLGHARNDIFFRDNSDIVKKVKSFYGLSDDVKIILYAPTHRDDNDTDCFNMDYKKVISACEKKYNTEFVMLLRFHPWTLKLKKNLQVFDNKILDGNLYDDMQELLATSDVLITDYSSCIFDYFLTRKPGFIYATDIEKYNNLRGFYYSIETTPFPIAINNNELISKIENFDENRYKMDIDTFLNDKGCVDDGNASKRIVDLIEKLRKS